MRAHSRCVSRVSLAALALLLAPAVAAVTPVKGSGLVAGAAPAAVRPSAPAAGSADAAALLAAAAREPDLAALVARVTALLQGEPLESAAAAPPPARAAAVPAAASAGALDVLPAAAAPPASAGALQLEKVEASVGRELQNNPCRTYTSCSPCASDYYCAWCSNAVGSPAYNCVNYNSGFAPAGCGNYAPDSSYCPGGSGGVSTPSASPYPDTGAVALSTSPTADSTRLLGAALGATLGIGAAAALLSAFLGVRFDAATASAPKPPAATQWAGQAAAGGCPRPALPRVARWTPRETTSTPAR